MQDLYADTRCFVLEHDRRGGGFGPKERQRLRYLSPTHQKTRQAPKPANVPATTRRSRRGGRGRPAQGTQAGDAQRPRSRGSGGAVVVGGGNLPEVAPSGSGVPEGAVVRTVRDGQRFTPTSV
jgi:hypothetical protein